MSQTKAQLVAPVGVVTATAMTITGILTATTLDGIATGVAASIAQGKNLNVGVVTASGISGDIAGSATSITQGNNVTFGSLTGTFVGDLTGNAVGNVTGDALSATVIGITTSNNVSVGVITSTNFIGDGSNISGAGPQPVSQQSVTANGATTAIDLSSGNLIYMSQSANTTVSFANTSKNNIIYIVRVKDDNTTARTITWPSSINWNGGSAPALLSNASPNDAQIFELVTRDLGVTWYGKEVFELAPDYTMWTWGMNYNGELGQNNSNNLYRSSPTQVGTDSSWSKTGLAGDQSSQTSGAGIKNDGTLWVWGDDYQGGLGLNGGTGIEYSSPTQVGTDTTWASISIDRSTWATKTDGTLWTMGYNIYGQLGQNNRAGSSSPVQMPGTDWSTVGQGMGTKSAIKTDGTLWVCGSNGGGYLAQNNTSPANISSPVQIPGTTWSKILYGQDFALALKTDNTLWSWGYNGSGSSGLGNNTKHSSPTQVGTDTTWADVGAGYNGVGAVKTDGTLWTWGSNTHGQLGQNNRTNSNSPVQVPGTTWRSVRGSYNWMAATRTDGTLWSWGYNGHGRLGLNDRTNYSSPVQVGTATDWQSDIAPRGSFFQAMRQA